MDATGQIQVKALQDEKPRHQIERLAWQGGNQLQRAEAGLYCRGYARGHELTPQATASHGRMHEECTNAGRLFGRVKQRVRSRLGLIPTEKRPSLAPAATGNDPVAVLNDEVGLIIDQLGIDTENVASDRVCLLRRIEANAQGTPGEFNELAKGGNVRSLSGTKFHRKNL